MAHEHPSGSYLQAIRRAFDFARETGSSCRPLHFLVGIAEGDGPAARVLTPPDGRSLRTVVTGMASAAERAPAGYLHMQAQQGARSLADAQGQQCMPEHLLAALIEQGTPEVLGALSQAGLGPSAVRRAALSALGLAATARPAIAFEPVTPAGTLDRPPLPVAELDQAAWSALRWRQDHLPVGRLHRRWDTEALFRLERAAVWRLADQLGLDDDQRFSLTRQHEQAVDDRVADLRPEVARLRGDALRATSRARARARLRQMRRLRPLSFAIGWGAWFSNRWAGIWDRWFRLRTLAAYRGAQQP
jgi:hypothetical protein